jgi:hypothetical protein
MYHSPLQREVRFQLNLSTCRRAEALAAANSLGVPSSNVRMLGVEDGGLEAAS